MFLQSTSQIGLTGVKSMVYGDSGVGKTRLLATAPNPVIFSAEAGLLSLRKFNIPYAEIRSLQDLEQAYQWTVSSHEARQFYTIGIDSISEIAEVVLKNEMQWSKDPRKAYGELLVKVVDYIRKFRDLPYRHVVMIAKQEYDKDETTGMMIFQPSFPGRKLSMGSAYFFDEVFQMFVWIDPQTKTRYEILRCRRDHQNMAKDRSGALAEFEQPNLNMIYQKIMATGV